MKRIGIILGVLASIILGPAASHAVLYFPHIATDAPWQTEICVINPGETATVQGNLETYSYPDGARVDSRPLSIAPKTRQQFDVGSQLTGAANNGYIVFRNTSGWPIGYTKFSQTGGDRVAIPAADNVNTGNIYVTHIAWDPWWTGIALVNTTAVEKTLTIRFNSFDIFTKRTTRAEITRTITLAPMQKYVNTVEGLLGGTYENIVSAEIEGADGIVGLELFAIGMGGVIGGVPLISGTASTLYFPHVTSEAPWWTGLVAYNPSDTDTQVTINAYRDSGALSRSSSTSIAPGGRFFGDSTAPELNLPPDTAWFSLQSQKPLVGFELFGTFDGKRLAGYSSVDIDGQTGIFPKLEKDGWTGIAFVNTENRQVTVTNRALDNAGNELATVNKILNPHQKWVGNPVHEVAAYSLFPWAERNAVNAATYLSFSADGNVAGFQLNNNSPLLDTMLDALPAASPSGLKVIKKALDFFKYQSDLTSGIAGVTDIITDLMSENPSNTCPQVTIVPSLDTLELDNLPPAITITADYGSGCTSSQGSRMSGKAVLAITNLTMTEDPASLSLDFALTATSLSKNGVVMLNGSVSGHLASDDASGAAATIEFNSFQVADTSISGGLTVTASNIDLAGATAGGVTIAFNNLTAAGYSVYSGTMTMTTVNDTTTRLDVDMQTSQGRLDLTMTVQQPTDTRIIINTVFPGTIAGYTVSLTGVTIDTAVCSGYPSSGSATVSQGASVLTIAFTPGDCPTGDTVAKSHSAYSLYPTSYLDPWQALIGIIHVIAR